MYRKVEPRAQEVGNAICEVKMCPQARDYVENFLKHCSRSFIQLIQLCGHNRARQRDKLAHLLEDFAELQDEVQNAPHAYSNRRLPK